ncbi:isocitrate dehydrogenase family protein [Arthroderma uncinatum]|uniref:isocitrate dehydrogenase family protein n=1 Tax=Arthroderma uncinatum TaxID=74035 RepID=UPI00144A7A7B|nr:isocitrate dehydrogenase family protein [Arthroderma uncinatum]KAF3480138.1 isocitrate dehydrogenase family protein [Arthroderma uncinatum]
MHGTGPLRVGVAIGHGTGPELAAAFEHVAQQLASRYSLRVEFVRSDRIYHSYNSLPLAENNQNATLDTCDETVNDITHYQQFCEQEASRGLKVIFRTAISAQSLYTVRQQLEAVKVECFDRGTSSLLVIRDQAQGFYTGTNKLDQDQNSVSRTCEFRKEVFQHIIAFSLERAREKWGDDLGGIKSLLLVYKFHLFDGLLLSWAKEWTKEFGIKVEFVQPDTMNRNLIAFGVGRCLMVAGNEYADIMQTIFLEKFNMRVQETSCSENVYLHPVLNRLSEYQTTHGSADDITGKGIVNPSATIRAAAAILERFGGCTGVEAEVDGVLNILQQNKSVTPDQGGNLTTSAFIDIFLQTLPSPSVGSPAASECSQSSSLVVNEAEGMYQAPDLAAAFMGKPTAVVVIDFQNDFIALGNPATMNRITDALLRVLAFSRSHAQEVVFIQHLGDSQYQGASWRHRNCVQNRKDLCLEGTWGAELSPALSPEPGELIFNKKAQFDAFQSPDFEKYISEKGIEHVVLMGLYADICIDATAKAAFQRGLWTTVVQDCTTSLHLKEEDILGYMQKVYGARVVESEKLLRMHA